MEYPVDPYFLPKGQFVQNYIPFQEEQDMAPTTLNPIIAESNAVSLGVQQNTEQPTTKKLLTKENILIGAGVVIIFILLTKK